MLYLNYNEEQPHGTRDFPIAFYHVDCNHPRYEMPFHWHKEFEIVKIIEGSFSLLLMILKSKPVKERVSLFLKVSFMAAPP